MLSPEINKKIGVAYSRHKENFKKCNTNFQKINFFTNNNLAKKPDSAGLKLKNDEKSPRIRIRGNDLFKTKQYFQALECYTTSLALGDTKETICSTYSNRSALLEKMGLYVEALSDLDRALEIEPKPNLISRKQTLQLKIIKRETKKTRELLPEVYNLVVGVNEYFGNLVAAKKDLEIGEIIVTELPLAASLIDNDFLYCHECLNLSYNLIPCDNCSAALYCGNACKDKAFTNYHKYECKIIDCIQNISSKSYIMSLALKITLTMLYNPKDPVTKVQHFKTHCEDRSWKNLFKLTWITTTIFEALKQRTNFAYSEDIFQSFFLSVLQIITINSFSINCLEVTDSGYKTMNYGCGLYSFGSYFNHSCFPNAFCYHNGTQFVVRALNTIKKGDQLFISYGPTISTASKFKRQTLLSTKYFFVCSCRACTENWPQEVEENPDFETPMNCVQAAISHLDHELLKSLAPTFVKRLKELEGCNYGSTINCFRQLVVDCYQIYEDVRMVTGKGKDWK